MEGLAFLNDEMSDEPGRCHEQKHPDYDDGDYGDYYEGGDRTQFTMEINLPIEDE